MCISTEKNVLLLTSVSTTQSAAADQALVFGQITSAMEVSMLVVIIVFGVATVLFMLFAAVLAYKTRSSTDEALRIMDLNAPLLPK